MMTPTEAKMSSSIFSAAASASARMLSKLSSRIECSLAGMTVADSQWLGSDYTHSLVP